MRKNALLLSVLSIAVSLAVVSCDDEEIGPFAPDRLVVSGPGAVEPGDTATYFTALYEDETYNWSVPTGATIVEGAGTNSIDITFGEAFSTADSGNVTVSARGLEGTKTVKVSTTAPTASVTLDSTVTALASGQTADVTISFDQDIATDPDVTLVGSDSVSRAVDNLERVDARTYRFTYTAGEEEGIEQVGIDNAVTTPFFGSVEMDTIATFMGYRVDNTSATGELLASRTPVTDSTTVTLSAMFSEVLSTTDSVKVSIVGNTTGTDYVTEATMMTEDGMSWTYEFQPEGGANETATVSVSNLPSDLVDNPTAAVTPIIIGIRND